MLQDVRIQTPATQEAGILELENLRLEPWAWPWTRRCGRTQSSGAPQGLRDRPQAGDPNTGSTGLRACGAACRVQACGEPGHNREGTYSAYGLSTVAFAISHVRMWAQAWDTNGLRGIGHWSLKAMSLVTDVGVGFWFVLGVCVSMSMHTRI